MLSGSEEIYTQVNHLNNQISNAPLESTTPMQVSNATTPQNVFSTDDEILTSHETPTFNFDYNKALVLYNDAMLKHMLSIVYKNDDTDFEFNEKTFIMLVFSHDDEFLTSYEALTLNFDYDIALVLYNDMLLIVYQNDDIVFEFNEQTFIVLDPYIETSSAHTCKCFFSHLCSITYSSC